MAENEVKIRGKCKATLGSGRDCNREALLKGYCILHFKVMMRKKRPKKEYSLKFEI